MVKGNRPLISSPPQPKSSIFDTFDCQVRPQFAATQSEFDHSDLASKIQICLEQGQFAFYLHEKVLLTIQRSLIQPNSLSIAPRLLTRLQHYALLDETGYPQSGLTFCTYYSDRPFPDAQTPQTSSLQVSPFGDGDLVLKSVIAWDGNILHQICDRYLIHPQGRAIVSAHHWLVYQLLSQIPHPIAPPLKSLLWRLASIVMGLALLLCIPLLFIFPLAALLLIGLSCLVLLLPQRHRQVNRWLWRSLSARNPIQRDFATWVITQYFL
jgi:hypothetical protein